MICETVNTVQVTFTDIDFRYVDAILCRCIGVNVIDLERKCCQVTFKALRS